MSIRRWGNRTALVATTALLATVGVSVAPANAGLLDGTLRPARGHPRRDDLRARPHRRRGARPLLGPTGWLVEDGTTSLGHVSDVIGATQVRAQGFDGRGVGVALIDTGVAPVPGLSSGNVVNGPDLSFESQSAGAPLPRHVRPRNAHGGDHRGQRAGSLLQPGLRGVAPGARLTSIKVATTEGAVDVSKVIAAVDWVVAHRNDHRGTHPADQPVVRHRRGEGPDARRLTHAVENASARRDRRRRGRGKQRHRRAAAEQPAYDPPCSRWALLYRGTVAAADDLGAGFQQQPRRRRPGSMSWPPAP